MNAVVFGAGKIARGFIGQLLYLSNANITFIDINKSLVAALNEKQSYHVYILGDTSLDCDVSNYNAITFDNKEEIYNALTTADIAFVSVGGQNLKSVGNMIGSIYHERGIPDKICNFITCENWKDAGTTLYSGIIETLDTDEKVKFDHMIGVCESVIMRSATQPSEELAKQDPLGVWVQNYWYLPISADHFKGNLPKIKDCELMYNFGNFLTQKMYTNNTSNAVIAYNGYVLGYDILAEAANCKEIAKLLDTVYIEINETLIKELNLDRLQQEEFAKKARAKYCDYTIVDRVIRHGKDPLRKLGPQDRLIAPARMALKHGVYPEVIIDTIAKALYFDEKSDEAAMELKQMRQDYGIEYVLKTVCKLDEKEPLYNEVMNAITTLRASGLVHDHE